MENIKVKKEILFNELVIKLFKEDYQDKVTDTSSDLYDKFESECIEIAKEIGLDTDGLTFDGELIGFEKDYFISKKSFYWTYTYSDDELCYYEWI
jgi:hypothetical protein